MKLLFAFIADSAQFTKDGKMWVLGGDIDYLVAPAFPFPQPSLTFVAKTQLEDDDLGREHTLGLQLLDPDERHIIKPMSFALDTVDDRPPIPQLPAKFGFTVTLQQTVFLRDGLHILHILADGLEIGNIPLYIIQAGPTTGLEAPRVVDAESAS